MQIFLNGQAYDVNESITIRELLVTQGLAAQHIAVEVDGEIIPRAEHEHHVLSPGARVEIVRALGGG